MWVLSAPLENFVLEDILHSSFPRRTSFLQGPVRAEVRESLTQASSTHQAPLERRGSTSWEMRNVVSRPVMGHITCQVYRTWMSLAVLPNGPPRLQKCPHQGVPIEERGLRLCPGEEVLPRAQESPFALCLLSLGFLICKERVWYPLGTVIVRNKGDSPCEALSTMWHEIKAQGVGTSFIIWAIAILI